ncbi:MAG TPA: tryptophan--tRNA ligase [Acidimicrobiales bacterium]|nr:tryptophan--tRNA ligase [Acidimicrobiales bacterium]
MPRVFSGIQPTGDLHLGSYLGAIRRWVEDQHAYDAFYCVVDLHAVTLPQDPEELRRRTRDVVVLLAAAGLDPEVCTLFVQSQVPEHAQLCWLMECTASYGELSRMTQFKEKGERAQFTSAGLFTYPALQAADILLYDTDRVPVGDDQRQHVELARDVAVRFNSRYGETFVVPEHAIPTVAARVMDLQEPTRKMSKSVDSPQGTVLLLDPPDTITKKIKRAVTDNDGDVRYDPVTKPGVANLLEILGALTGADPADAAKGYEQYGPLKAATAEAVVESLRPFQARYAELSADPAEVDRIIARGADKAQAIASVTLARAMAAMGLLPRA